MFEPGKSGNPNGRPKGVPNKATMEIKKAYEDLLQGNLPEIQGWLNRVAATDPAKALDFLMKLSPFVLPKKQEMDLNMENPINIVIPPKKDDTE